MYPHVEKEVPSAPPSYTETMSSYNPQHAQQQAPPYGMNINQQQAPPPLQAQVIVVQAGIPPLGPQSVQCICPTCKTSVQTSVDEESSTSAYLCCMLMFIIGCGLCSCIPFCMDNFKVYKHSCPRCRAFIGTYQQQ